MQTIGRFLTLALLSAVTAEFLLGDQWLQGLAGPGAQLVQLVLFTVFYGSAAVLIREVARRTGRGWPTILLLALAFGVIEEGVVDQSLFNPDFAGQRLLDPGYLPSLGIGVPWTIFVLSLHVIWSMGAPIAIAEAIFPRPRTGGAVVSPQRQAPWLGRPGIVVATALYLLGATSIFVFSAAGGFMARPGQLIGSVVLAALVVVVALRLPSRPPVTTGRFGAAGWLSLVVALVATGAIQVVTRSSLAPWLTCTLYLLVFAVGIAVVTRWRLDVTGLAVGALLTYGWVGLLAAAPLGAVAITEQSLIVVAVLVVAAVALRRRSRSAMTADREPVAV